MVDEGIVDFTTKATLVSTDFWYIVETASGVVNKKVNQSALRLLASQITDFDTEVANNAAVTLNTAKVTNATHTGDVSGATVLTIANNAVTLAKMADIATSSFLGRVTAATGDPEVLTVAQATALLNIFTSGLQGVVPASGGGTTNFLRADGTFAAPAGGGDMVLADVQTVTGAKTFNDTKFFLRNVANTFSGSFVNTITAARVYTLPDETGTISLIGRTETLLGKTLTTPTIAATGFTNMQHTHQAANTGSQLVATLALTATGTKDSTTFLRGDDTWAVPGGAGDMILASVQTVTGAKTFGTIGGAVGKFILAGSTSGSTIVNAAAVAGSTTITFPGTTGTVALIGDKLDVFASTTSAELRTVISDETGTGGLVFATSPTIVTPTIASFTNATHNHQAASGGGTLLSTSALSDTANIAYLNTDNTFLTNTKQTFTHQSSKAGIALAAVAGDVTSPNNGEYWYNSTSNKFRAREGGSTVDMIGGGAAGLTFAKMVKPDDETVTSSTTFQDDDDISFTPTINKIYGYLLLLIENVNSTPDMKFIFSVPTGCTMISNADFWGLADNPEATADRTVSRIQNGQNADRMSMMTGNIVMSSTAGNVTLQFAQNTSNAAATTMKAGTYMIVWEES